MGSGLSRHLFWWRECSVVVDTAWYAVALLVPVICLGMATWLLARGPRGWRGLMAGLVCAAILFTVASVLLEPHNPYWQGGLAVAGFVALSVLLTISGIGLAVVSVARRLRG